MSGSGHGVADVAGAVGGTALVPLRRIVPEGHARIVVKLESHNPTGSMKDRMALSVVERALADGRLRPDGTVVEYSGGSTGTSLAFVCAARGIGMTVVTSDAFSVEKRDHMRALGARVIEIPSDGGRITRELIQAMMARAAELCREQGTYAADQFNNRDAQPGYASLGEEIWAQTGGRVDAFVQSVGTGHCLAGVGNVLRSRERSVALYAVEPAESAVLSGGKPGAHGIEGTGPGFVPPLWDPGLVDGIVAVSTAEAEAMARRLAREEGIFGGTSTGGNVVAALRVAGRLGPQATVATLVCDSGMKYLSTRLYREGAKTP